MIRNLFSNTFQFLSFNDQKIHNRMPLYLLSPFFPTKVLFTPDKNPSQILPTGIAQLVRLNAGKYAPSKNYMVPGGNLVINDTLNLPSGGCCGAVNALSFGCHRKSFGLSHGHLNYHKERIKIINTWRTFVIHLDVLYRLFIFLTKKTSNTSNLATYSELKLLLISFLHILVNTFHCALAVIVF